MFVEPVGVRKAECDRDEDLILVNSIGETCRSTALSTAWRRPILYITIDVEPRTTLSIASIQASTHVEPRTTQSMASIQVCVPDQSFRNIRSCSFLTARLEDGLIVVIYHHQSQL